MSLISFQPVKVLIEAWKRLRLSRGDKWARDTEEKRKQPLTGKPHHRHSAFFELP
jgi:hypothetical protein